MPVDNRKKCSNTGGIFNSY